MMIDLVEASPARTKPVNLLKYNRTYEAFGQTPAVAAQPAVLHFGGINPGQSVKQVVQLRNISNIATRLHVVPPDSQYFQVTHQRKQGSIAPGLSEQLIVEFNSNELRYHYDCIRVQTEGGGLLIPLHAYPTLNEVQLPKLLDLGRVAVGESITQHLQLSCKVPLDFDFTVTIVKHNRTFTVSPLSGTVPANDSTVISITFAPTTYTTEELQLQVLVNEFNARPMSVTVTGSCVPGIATDKLVASATGSSSLAGEQQIERSPCSAAALRNKGAETICKVVGGGDACTVRQELQYSLVTGRKTQHSTLLPALPHRQQPEVLVDGTYFPPTLSSHHDVNCVLNQSAGKLRTKDIKAAIAGRKRELQLEQQELDAVLAVGTAAGLDPLDQPNIQPAIKEALFQLQLQRVESGARHCTGLMGSQGQVIGQDPPSPGTVKRLKAARQAMLDQHHRDIQEQATHRLELEMLEAGALHILQPQPQQAQQQQDQQLQSGSSTDCPGGEPVSFQQACANSTSASTRGYPGLEGFKPQWLLLESNEWRKRVQVTQRFVNAVRVVMYRNRAQARIKKLKTLAARFHSDKERIAGLAVQEVVMEGSSVQRHVPKPTQLLLPERVRAAELPVYRPARYAIHAEVEAGQYGEFTMLQQQPYKAEFEYKLLAYTVEDYPGLIPYLPPCKDQPLMVGAGEEVPGGLPCGLLPPGLADNDTETMPEGLGCSPFACFEIGDKYTNDQVYVPLAPHWGCEAEALLQPRLYQFHDSAAAEGPGSSGVRALAAASLQAHGWLPLQNSWQAGGPIELPKLMTGPDTALLEPEAAEDSDKPQVPVRMPDVLPYLPADGATGCSGAVALMGQQHQQELDARKQHQKEAAVATLTRTIQAYNQLLERPHRLRIQH